MLYLMAPKVCFRQGSIMVITWALGVHALLVFAKMPPKVPK